MLSLHSCSHWEYRRYCLKIQQIGTGCNKQSISMKLRRPQKGQWPILWERCKKMVSFEMSLEKGNCISWTWWYKTLQVEGNNMSRGRGHDLESYVYDLSKSVEIQCLRVMVRTKRWNRCCKQILISGPHIVNHAHTLELINSLGNVSVVIIWNTVSWNAIVLISSFSSAWRFLSCGFEDIFQF